MTVRPTRRPARRGSVIPLLAVCVVALFGFVALAVDIGMMMIARTECQNAADAAALAGVRTLNNNVPAGQNPDTYDNGKPTAEANARTAITSNIFLNTNFTDARVTTLRVGIYDYNTSTQQFTPDYPANKPSGKAWSTVEVEVNGTQPAYFARVLGITSMPMSARAVAVHRPRDIALVLDYTGSMGYGTTLSYPVDVVTSTRATSATYRRLYNSNDPAYPQFGHYARYLAYAPGSPDGSQKDAAVGNRPHPLYQTATVISAPYVYSPANATVTTDNGPAVIKDFLYDPLATGSTVTTSALTNAFHANSYALTRSTGGGVLAAGPTPAPENFKDQSDSPTVFDGDKWPRKYGYVAPAGTPVSWDVTTTNGAAIHAAELLGWSSRYTGGTSLPAITYPSGRSETNFRDATWERYGYDLDIAHYIANRNLGSLPGSGVWDPRYDAGLAKDNDNNTPNPPSGSGYSPSVTAGKFKGYTMGPGYWGKTFFIWPPDPRPAHDWRRKFFLKASGSAFVTGSEPGASTADADVDNDTVTADVQTINGALLTDANSTAVAGLTLNVSGTYSVNYPAILAWIKSGPQVLPPNLRAGRVKYYTSIPDDVNTSTGTTEQIADKRFWRAYIDYVLTSSATYGQTMAGLETQSWPEGVASDVLSSSALGRYDPDNNAATNNSDPRPYMRYTDNPPRPRMHLWFGPVTMLQFIDYKNMYPGTCHQAQCWQLKAGVNSALDDIKANHPNDLVGMAFFSNDQYYDLMVHTGQDWTTLKNSLFFPKSILATMTTSTTAEVRPYNSSVTYTGWGDVPNAQGSTDPNTGLALAFNLLSPSQYVNPSDAARRGRRGASKMVIFETDGVPNSAQKAVFTAAGYDSYYSTIGGPHPTYTSSSQADDAALEIIGQMRKTMAGTTSGDSGLSLPNAPVKVYAIGFGDIFNTSAGPAAASFLLDVQKRGGTSKDTDTSIPSYQIITGTYTTRINNLRTALERILQSGVQVTLIE